jgi:hypothetical protein
MSIQSLCTKHEDCVLENHHFGPCRSTTYRSWISDLLEEISHWQLVVYEDFKNSKPIKRVTLERRA